MLHSKSSFLGGLLFLTLLAFYPNPSEAACRANTQMEINQCAANEYRYADRELNAYYSKLEKTKELVTAERAWIAYRDAECAYQAKFVEGGFMAPMVHSSCLTELTKQRFKQLIDDQQN